MTTQSAVNPAMVSGGSRKRAVAAATIGSALEWYDFIVYSFFAAMIGKLFFPAADPNSQLLIGLATFGVGFFMRPLGAIVLGIYGDRRGRRAALTLTIAIMIVGLLILTFTPTYQSAGFIAPVLVVLARLFQGFSAGGEFGGTTSYLSEYSLQNRRGLYVSWQMSSQFMASLLGGLVAALVTANLSSDALAAYGWRIPFAIGLLIGPVGFYIRRRLEDTPAFMAQTRLAESPLGETLRNHFKIVACGFGMVVLGTVCVYVLVLFLPGYASRQFHLPQSAAFAITAYMSLVGAIWCVIAGWLSDRVGRKPLLMISSIGLVILTYPLFAFLAAAPSLTRLVIIETVFALLVATFAAVSPTLLAELFPTRVRNTALAISYNIAVAIFGGFGQLIVAWLIVSTGDVLAPAYYVTAASVVGLIAVLPLADRTGQALE
ncbi:MAG TPA: MFS transporter [Stellaceae bacterium]|jgi:MHS family proline/betaine transporter-like MFS transporter